ncbi:MAG: hypothetical protein U0T77_06900 [Chitinophagales bacterium]
MATVTIFPFKNNNGQLEVLTSFDLSVTPSGNALSRLSGLSSQTYAANSMLGTGKWYKIGVPKAGVYKLDYTFCKRTLVCP